MDDNENAEFAKTDSSFISPQPVIYAFCADDGSMEYTYEVGEVISMEQIEAPLSLAQMIEEAEIVCVDDDVDINNLQNMKQFTATRLSDGQQEILKPANKQDTQMLGSLKKKKPKRGAISQKLQNFLK